MTCHGVVRMKKPQRSPSEIAEELKRLQRTPSRERDHRGLVHEVLVYQEELVVQQDELVEARAALEDTRDRFVELYDFAPNGYLVLDGRGIVRQCNLRAAVLVGKPRETIEGFPMLALVASEDRRQCLDFLRRCRAPEDGDVECELTLRTEGGQRRVQLLCRPRHGASVPARGLLISMIDITERTRLEDERAQIARDHAHLASRLISIQDEERHRIARNLHDDIGQQLTALRLKLDELALDTTGDVPQATIARAQEMVERLDRRLHFVASELRPPALDLGVVAAISQFVREWSNTFGVRASFRAADMEHGAVAPVVETQLYRIAQEALNNVSKHAGAQRVDVSLERSNDRVMLRVDDDGQGFDAATPRSDGAGLGLVGMRERAQLVGGRLEIRSAPGKGTVITVVVPNQPWQSDDLKKPKGSKGGS
jgi:PAS domain S-box-containing protein